ncbi:MAG: hypothetical protein ABI142_04720 [Bryocella sp.]
MKINIRLCLMLLAVVGMGCVAQAQHSVILDDDCSNDVDCVLTMPILFEMQHRGDVKVLAVMADSANPLTAPVFRIFAKQAGYPEMPIGANQTNEPSTALSVSNKSNESLWTKGLIARFAPSDNRTKYPDCASLYRKTLVAVKDHSVAIAATGFPTCLNQLLATKADKISALSGADLVKQKVSLLSVMGGKYPSGKEWNFTSDAPGWNALFTMWTKQHGFPPVYLNGFANGAHVIAAPTAGADPMTSPTQYALDLYHTTKRPMWDILSVMYAAWGAQHDGKMWFTVSKAGTVKVDAATGLSTWNAAANSGHFTITNAQSNDAFSALLDARTHHGLLWEAEQRALKPTP